MVTQQERVSLIEEVASRLDLSEFMDRKVSAMSGGMQRRLSIALAMLGSPRVVILDEPTTQLDPSTRRKVWECIQYFRESYKCAIVITTHSMEEADELCDRVCIITKGQIRAVDTPQGLKDRFGNGYVLILKVMPGHRQEALDFVKKHVYEQAVLGNCLNDVMRIYFPRDGFDLTHAFAELFSEKARTEGHIANFLLNQATLHDVFMNIAGLDEAHLEEIGYLNENAHELVVKLLRHRGFHASGVTPVQKASAPPSYPFR
ncbi:ABC transporter ATP-binding protein [Hondaea fermentalgiana]|uniref:ABC transporter ATP-binding protein n=1 Tax=Hondaea fermentalgiana TaxID=2315210 RepID=A0A2R5GM73_9STRA|nr:ABC transporter ATP-binding protein [Hondaea fermentalgiana]|eukprot:GBG29391.1 ABC transporter ATP-binding protein [Hondaea fermentalgiana]